MNRTREVSAALRRIVPQPSDHVSARIRARITEDLRPARGPSVRTRWVCGLAVAAATLLGVAATAPQAEAAALGSILFVGAAMACVLVATYVGLPRAFQSPVPGTARKVVIGLAPVAFVGLAALGALVLPHGVQEMPEGGMSHGRCLRMGVMLAALPMVVLFGLFRRADPFTPRLTGALIGAWAGVTAAAGLTVACLSADPVHVVVGHGFALGAGALIGLLLGRRVLSP